VRDLEDALAIYHVKEFDWNLYQMLLECISAGKAIMQATNPAVLAAQGLSQLLRHMRACGRFT